MQQQKLLKFAVVIFAILLLDVPKAFAAKHRKQGSPTTRGPPPSQAPPAAAPNQDAAKLSYGNQGPPPPAYGSNNQGPPPPAYGSHNQGPPPPYQQPGHAPPPYQNQPQPVIINHVQQPQSSGGGLGTAGGLAIGALAGAAGGYAISEALKDDDKKEEPTTTTVGTTTVAGASTTTSHAGAESTTPSVVVTTISSNETTTLNSNETTTLGNSSSVETTTLPLSAVNETLIEQKNATAVNEALSSDGIVAKISVNIVLLSFIYHFIF